MKRKLTRQEKAINRLISKNKHPVLNMADAMRILKSKDKNEKQRHIVD